jgi:hypothetical protein
MSKGILIVAALALLGCAPATAAASRYAPPFDPSSFGTRIDNPYWPMTPGSRWVYRETDGHGHKQRDVVTVTSATRVIAGVEARVVHDIATEKGEVVEDTLDFYAQDRAGNVWYLGEDTKELEHGKVVSTEGSWEAGVSGARAGIIVPAKPKVGMRYRQEFWRGHAEDRARILSLSDQAGVPFGHFRHVMLTEELNRLEPKVLEYKLYARGVGPVLALTASGGSDREELVRYKRGSG